MTLVDHHNFHTFQPLLYQIATAGLEPADVAYPVRTIFRRHSNVVFRHGEVRAVDLEARGVTLADGATLDYDRLVVATGATTGFLGVPGAQDHALPLYTLADARRLRNRVLACLEAADARPEDFDGGAPQFVVVGGGPTGVEMAGALVELLDLSIRRDRLRIDPDRTAVVLVEAGPRLLSAFDPAASRYAEDTLRARGVHVRLGTQVAEVTGDGVRLGDGTVLRGAVVVWAGGVTVDGTLAAGLECERGRGGRVVLEPDLSLAGHPEVFVVGDAGAVPWGPTRPEPSPQVAQVAIQSGTPRRPPDRPAARGRPQHRLHVPRQGAHGHHRPPRGGGPAAARARPAGHPRLVGVAGPASRVPDRVPQQGGGARQLVVALPQLAVGATPHRGRRRGRRVSTTPAARARRPGPVWRPEDVGAPWLTDVLVSAGVLAPGCRVVDVASAPVGTGQMADSYRLALTYDGDTLGAPSSVVGKFTPADDTSRSTALALRTSEVEVRFYQEVAPTVEVRTPRCYFADVDPATASFVLVLEDMAPAVQGDQMRGCSAEEAAAALAELARLHAPRWADPTLGELEWLGRDSGGATVGELLPLLFDGFVARYGAELDDDVIAVGTYLFAHIGAYLAAGDGPRTVQHADYRLDNLLFGGDRHNPTVAVVDWQTVTLGPGASDVSYFLGAGLPTEARRAHEEALVREYHERLTAGGVDAYRWDDCFTDYRRHAYAGYIMAVGASMLVERTARGDEMFLTMARRHAAQVDDLDTAALLGRA